MPSVRDLIFIALFFSLTCGSLAQLLFRDGGTGWHLRTGQIILASHAVPRTDPFSVSNVGKAWYAWEWLSDAAMGAAFNFAGLYGISLLTSLVVAATFTLLYSLLRRRGTGLFVSLVLVLLATGAATIHMFARPHVASWLLVLVWLAILESARQRDSRRLLWLLPVMLLWVNLHAGFLLGFVLLGCYWLEAIYARREANPFSPAWARWLASIGLGSIAITFANPYGYHLHAHIYEYLGNRFLMDHIQEFQSPNFHGIPERCFAALVLLALLGLMLARTKLALGNALLLLFGVYTGLYASRNLPVSSILIALVIGPIWSQALSDASLDRLISRSPHGPLARLAAWQTRMQETDSLLRGGIWIVVVLLIAFWMTVHGGALGNAMHMRAAFESARFPVQAVDFLKANDEGEPVFSTDQWGGYLIFRLYPEKVLVDDRHDLYGADFFKSYLRILHVEPGWTAQLDSFHAARVLVPAQSSLAGALEGLPEWRVEYRDPTAVLFRKVSAARP